MITKMKTEIEIIAPTPPNFIRTTEGGTIPVADLTAEQIEVVAALIAENFKAHCRQKRINKSKGQ